MYIFSLFGWYFSSSFWDWQLMTSKFIMKKLLRLDYLILREVFWNFIKINISMHGIYKFLQTNLEMGVLICLFFIYVHLIISLILIASVLPWWWSQRHLESVRILQYPLYSLQNVDLYKLSSLLVLCPMLLWSWLSLIHGKAKYETKLSCTVIYAKRGDKNIAEPFIRNQVK